ncbi:MAG TPA: S1C family serine protease [Candidatus Dormibacteraeota bacterium]|nr:S1C family serine protease [Candidatus Dormibacteraeota bacterium]
MRLQVPSLVAAAAVVAVAVTSGLLAWQSERSLNAEVASQQQTEASLARRVAALEAQTSTQADWAAVAAKVEPSVVTVETDKDLGSAWVARADASGSDLVTNFHVVADAWSAGIAKIQVHQGDRTFDGMIVRVDPNDDLALVHVKERFAPLVAIATRPKVGTTVMAVGSPLGLSGTISVGVVSGFHSIEGSDFLQFSAPISPGNSGGPVVDAHGRVVAIASAKFVGDGVEGLSLAIPIQTACLSLVTCTTA